MTEEEKDPDYNEFHLTHHVDRSKIREQDTKKQTVLKIETILTQQFEMEIEAKSQEISKINRHVRQTKAMLDRLRAYVVASYYGSGEKLIPMSKAVGARKKEPQASKPDSNNENAGVLAVNTVFAEQVSSGKIRDSISKTKDKSIITISEDKTLSCSNVENRFYVTKKIIVGNVSKYLVAGNQREKDRATHKWMVYVRGPQEEPDISHYVKSVWFFLHPSYIPNDIVQIHRAPFQLTRRGWGEFPIRVQLHFKDSNNKRFDILHNLKLDKTYTGLQTLGAETVVKLELCRHGNNDLFLPLTYSEQAVASNSLTQSGEYLSRQTSENRVNLSNHKIGESSTYTNDDNENDMTSISHSQEIKLDPMTRLKQIEALSSVVSSCVTSAAVSRCTSPVQSLLAKNNITDPEARLILHELIIDSPLISAEPDIRLRPFSCMSLELYDKWSFSKRRAAEWQRAVFMKRLFLEYIDAYNKVVIVPTTKQIMLWCRENGYTPQEHNLKLIVKESLDLCQLCGVLIGTDNQLVEKSSKWCSKCLSKDNKHCKQVSLSAFTNIFTEIQNKEKALISLNKLQGCTIKPDVDFEVDVIDCTNDNIQQPIESKETFVAVSSSKELEWVYTTTSQLGIHLPSVMINSIRGPVLQAMLHTAVKSFMMDLLCKSNTEAVHENKSTLEPALVTFKHISTVLNKTPQFDFLTDAYMGLIAKNEQSESSKK